MQELKLSQLTLVCRMIIIQNIMSGDAFGLGSTLTSDWSKVPKGNSTSAEDFSRHNVMKVCAQNLLFEYLVESIYHWITFSNLLKIRHFLSIFQFSRRLLIGESHFI